MTPEWEDVDTSESSQNYLLCALDGLIFYR